MGKEVELPENMSIEEASEFWDTHSVADYSTRPVQMEFELSGHRSLIAVEGDLLDHLRNRAQAEGISVETLINLWLQEKLLTPT